MFHFAIMSNCLIVTIRGGLDKLLFGEQIIGCLDVGRDINGDIVLVVLRFVQNMFSLKGIIIVLFDRLEIDLLYDKKPEVAQVTGIVMPFMYSSYVKIKGLTDVQHYICASVYIKWNVFELEYLIVLIHNRQG